MIAMTGFMLEALVAVLLVVTIFYCIVLERRIRAFKADQVSLAELVTQLSNATEHAQVAVAGLKSTAEEADDELDGKLKKARSLSEELAFMVETGNNLAGKLADPAQRSAAGGREAPGGNVAYLKTAARTRAGTEKTEPAFTRPAPKTSEPGPEDSSRVPLEEALRGLGAPEPAALRADQRMVPPRRKPAAPSAAMQGAGEARQALAQALRFAR